MKIMPSSALTTSTSKNLPHCGKSGELVEMHLEENELIIVHHLFTGDAAATDTMSAMWGCTGVVRGSQVCVTISRVKCKQAGSHYIICVVRL